VGCSSGPTITTIQSLPESADAPYEKILVITLFSSFDSRRYLETEIVSKLAELGHDAVASTSMMNTKTPMTRSTFVAMVDEIGADAILVTQLVGLEADATVKDMRPEVTINYWPTYYYNVFAVETTEYLEPQGLEVEYDLAMVSEIISVQERKAVWVIKSNSSYTLDTEQVGDYEIFVKEANGIVRQLSRDGLIAR